MGKEGITWQCGLAQKGSELHTAVLPRWKKWTKPDLDRLWQGELLLRDGVYLTEEPTALTLDGVYVAATGQLHARASPAGGQLRLPLNESEAQDLPEYRCAHPWISNVHSSVQPCMSFQRAGFTRTGQEWDAGFKSGTVAHHARWDRMASRHALMRLC